MTYIGKLLGKKESISCISYWSRLCEINPNELNSYYQIPFMYVKECKVQSMQYKIIHNFYPCRLKWFQWNIFESNMCTYCDATDNIIHYFVGCSYMQEFWNSLSNWWNSKCVNCNIENYVDVILGINRRECHSLQLNFILMYAKWFIYKMKYLEKECFFLHFLPELKTRLLVEEKIYLNQSRYHKFLELWNDILQSL